jgi:Flp pilus assembly protein TadD
MLDNYFSPKNLPIIIALTIFLSAFLLYTNTVPNDYVHIESTTISLPQHAAAQSFVNLQRPLPKAIQVLERAGYGNNPHISHLFSAFAYAACCSLLFVLLRLCIGNSSIATIATLLFTVHPIHTEAVASIRGIEDLLAMIFAMTSLYLIVKYIDRKNIAYFVLSVFSAFLSVLSNERNVTYIAVVPVTLYVFRAVSLKTAIRLTLPFVTVAIVWYIIRIFGKVPIHSIALSSDQIAAYFLMMGKSLLLLFWPHPLSWDYPIVTTTWANPRVIGVVVVYAAILCAGVVELLKRSVAGYGIALFLCMIVIPTASFNERLLFLPSIGFCLVVAATFDKFRGQRIVRTILLLAIMVLCACLTISRNRDWADTYTLVSRDIIKNPNSAKAHKYLADELRLLGEKNSDKKNLLTSAVAEYQKSLALDPHNSNTWYYLGITLYQLGNKDDASLSYMKAVAIDSLNTNALNNLGTLFFEAHEFDSATSYYLRALRIDPQHARACANMAIACHMQLQFNDAASWYEKALVLNPDDATLYRDCGELYLAMNDTTGANRFFAKAQKIDSSRAK